MKRSENVLAMAGLLLAAPCSLLAGDGVWTSEGPPHTAVYSLALGQSPRTVFASTFYGLLRSTEVGVWNAIPGTSQNAGPIAVAPSDPGVLYATGNDSALLRSSDNGGHFDVLSGVSFPLRAIAVDPVDPDTLYIGGYSQGVGGGTVYKSRDAGKSWLALHTTLLVNSIASLVIDPVRHDSVYAGADVWTSSYYYPEPTPPGANYALIGSQNAGDHWSPLLGGSSVPALAIDPRSGAVYAATSDSNGVSVSQGAGTRWTPSPIGLGLAVFGVNALLVDPKTPSTVYAGTTLAGVFRSLDGGATWAPMNDGLADDETYGHANRYSGLWVHSLALDPADGVLRAGTENGVFAIRPDTPSGPCTPAPEHLCLLQGRYRVSVMAQNRRSWVVARGTAVEETDRYGYFSFPDFTGDPAFPEVVVKMVDPSLGAGVWVFHGSLTNLPYILTVTDTITGKIETYTNDQDGFCGGADTSAFLGDDSGAGTWDYSYSPGAVSVSSSGIETLSLLGGRFTVTLSAFSASRSRAERGVAVPRSDRYGYFSLPGFTGDPAFPEVYVKMVDLSAVNGNFWFFYTGLTNLDYTLTVTDSVTGAVRTYASATPYCGGADTHAFTD